MSLASKAKHFEPIEHLFFQMFERIEYFALQPFFSKFQNFEIFV